MARLPVFCDGLSSSVSGWRRCATCEFAAACEASCVSVRVLVIALVVQLVLATAFIVWAASGFPLP
jgi:hypothetical protein